MLLHRRRRRDVMDAERRARETAATSRIEDALASLIGLARRPDEMREIEEDRRYRQGQSLDGDDLPAEPETKSLEEWDRRRADLRHALECVGALRRGDPLPSAPKPFTDTVALVDVWIEWQEERDRLEKQEWAEWQAARNSSSPVPSG
jgi:hypothetical protein